VLSGEKTVAGRRRPATVTAGLAVVAALLAMGGWVAHAAATASATPVLASESWSGQGGPTVGAPSPPTPAPGGDVVTPSVAPGSGSSAVQTFGISVLPGPLTVSPTTASVPLSPSFAFGHRISVYQGQLPPVTVVDARGSLVGWRATVSLQSVAGAASTQLAHAFVCASSPKPTYVAGNPGDVVRGEALSCAGVGDPLTVFWAAPGGGGGTFSDTAVLRLVVPGGKLPAEATASFAVAVS